MRRIMFVRIIEICIFNRIAAINKASFPVRRELPTEKRASHVPTVGRMLPNCGEDASKLWEENFPTVGGSPIAVRREIPNSKSWKRAS